MIEFAYPWALFALLGVIFLYYFERHWRRRPSIVVSSARPFAALRRHRNRLGIVEYLMLAGAVVLVFALARPRFGDEKVIVRADGIDIILAIDMSGSMNAFDVPRNITDGRKLLEEINAGRVMNRLDVAKQEIRRFIESRPNDRIGLIGFADLAYSFSPPTLDHSWLIARLEQLEPGLIGDATGIASPIGSAVSRLRSSAAPRRVLVLFTDGANTAVNRLTPAQAAELAKEFNVVIHTVGIGSDNAYMLDNTFGSRFIPYGDNFDEKLLRSLAEVTGGTYFHAADADGMKAVMERINELEKTSVEQPRYVEYREYAPLLALIAAGLFLLGFVIQSTWKLRLP